MRRRCLLLLVGILAPFSFSYAQGLLFRELYSGPAKQAELNVTHQQAISSWHSPYGHLSRTEAALTSQGFEFNDNQGSYLFEARHSLQRFGRKTSFGTTLEHPEFSGVIDYTGARRIVVGGGVESPSDEPFESMNETTFKFTVIAAPKGDLRRQKENYWLYFLNYSNTRSFLPNIPLPGVSYIIPTDSGWMYSLGAPFFSVSYVNFPRWNFHLTAGPYFYSTGLFYGPPTLQGGVSSSWKQSSYFLSERTNKKERLFMDEKDVSFVLKHPLSTSFSLEWRASYKFDQVLLYGENYAEKTRPTEDLGSSVVLAVSLKAKLDSLANQ